MDRLAQIRSQIRNTPVQSDATVLAALARESQISEDTRHQITEHACGLVTALREDDHPALLEVFLAEYGLSTEEGVALMCLAEAFMRVPDTQTIDDLIEDKIAPSAWADHRGHGKAFLVNASTWGLMLTGKVLSPKEDEGLRARLHLLVKRLGEPVIRTAIKQAMKELGSQFVLGETIEAAVKRGQNQHGQGSCFSYDMLGEAALTEADAQKFFQAYKTAIVSLAPLSTGAHVADNPGISIKLSALHPRYAFRQKDRVMAELVPRLRALTLLAKEANMGLNIDAEESERLDLSLDVIAAVFQDNRLAGWDGFGVVVQAYHKKASLVLDWLYSLAQQQDRTIMVRLVKGAYWDREIKRAQSEGLSDFPVFTRKAATDCSYLYCAEKLLTMTDRLYPQFATHNAHSVAMILELAGPEKVFEFQRLHGMGASLYRLLGRLRGEKEPRRCRIYAPVGPHRDLLAYLVRRLLENGANSSFVHQLLDHSLAPDQLAADPLTRFAQEHATVPLPFAFPKDLFAPERQNAKGWDLENALGVDHIDAARSAFAKTVWTVEPLTVQAPQGTDWTQIVNPANPKDRVGTMRNATPEDVTQAVAHATAWTAISSAERAQILNKAADLYEEHFGLFFAVLSREAGKTQADSLGELREAVDFLRYYAAQAETGPASLPRGLFACISPWNFPLAIFTGQIAAALAVGNGVLAKPAEQTPITAFLAVGMLHQAGVPRSVLQLLPGTGTAVGAALTQDPRINGVCFTGSTATAQSINRSMAASLAPTAPLIAETGGLNAMIVDSTALPEQAVKDILTSAFQSAGQRCSALRVLYIQDDIAPSFLDMLLGALDEMRLGDPWQLATDIGPVIDAEAQEKIARHIAQARTDQRLLYQKDAPKEGRFVGPAVIAVSGLEEVTEEIFGPVLHIATFQASALENVLATLNAAGYGLTFGLHSRLDGRVRDLTKRIKVGNIYVNRNQIGAIVGAQPFGGEGLSGTGPKAGGPHYVKHFTQTQAPSLLERPASAPAGPFLAFATVQQALHALPAPCQTALRSERLPGPTGESNVLSFFPRGVVLCLGPGAEAAQAQAARAEQQGCTPLMIAPDLEDISGHARLSGSLNPEHLAQLEGIDAVISWADAPGLRAFRKALAAREGALLPLLSAQDGAERLLLERHVCIDLTAAGGNVALLAKSSPP